MIGPESLMANAFGRWQTAISNRQQIRGESCDRIMLCIIMYPHQCWCLVRSNIPTWPYIIYIYSLGIILNYPDVWLNSATHHPGTSTAASTACRLPVQSLGVELNDRDRADERIAASHNSGSAVFRNDNAQNCGSKGQNLCCHQCTSQFAVNTRVLIGFWSNMNLFGRVPKLPTNLVVLAFCTCNYMYSYYIHFYLNIHIYIYITI